MRRLLALAVTLLAGCIVPCEGDAADRRSLLPVPAGDIALNSTEGERLLRECTHYPGVDVLMNLATQRNQAFCSAATAATLLNAMSKSIPAPVDVEFAPYPYHTQRSILADECVRATPTHVSDDVSMSAKFLATHGATLHEWATYLACFVDVSHTHASTTDAAAFRDALKDAFPTTRDGSASKFVGINFVRTGVGEVGGGHMSPIAAFDETTDRVLIADVSRYKYPPVWATLASVFNAMNTTDAGSGQSRGWVMLGPGGAGGSPSALNTPFVRDEYVARRAACMDAVSDDDDWDGVMGCTRWPVAFPPDLASEECSKNAGVSVGGAAAIAFVFTAVGGGCVGGWWWYVEQRSAGRFRRHVVLGSEFEDA